jgi:rare lipoprotein A
MKNCRHCLVLLILILTIAGCAPKGRYYQHQDSAPKIIPQNVTTKDVVPKYETYAPANMRPYTIRGVKYRPLKTGKNFSDEGQLVWTKISWPLNSQW